MLSWADNRQMSLTATTSASRPCPGSQTPIFSCNIFAPYFPGGSWQSSWWHIFFYFQCWKWVAPGAAWPAHHPRPQSEDLNLVCDTRAGPGPGAGGASGQPQPGAWDRGSRVAPGAWQILTSTDTHIQLHSCPDSPQPPLVCFTIDAKVNKYNEQCSKKKPFVNLTLS